MRKFNYQDLLNSEQQTIAFSRSYLRGVNDNLPICLDTFLQLMYFVDKVKDINTLEGEFRSYCWCQYLQAPYSFRACFLLYENGHYLESSFVLRHLIEILAKMKYLEKHKEMIRIVWKGERIKIKSKEGKRKLLTIKDIFSEIAPEYYKINYGFLLSGLLHGSPGKIIFRANYHSPSSGEVVMGARWNEKLATFIINNFIAFLYGYLNYFPKIFPEGLGKMDTLFHEQYQGSMHWLEKSMECHKKEYPRASNYYKNIDPLIR